MAKAANSAPVVEQQEQTTNVVGAFTPAKEIPFAEIITRISSAKAAGKLRGLGNGASLRAFEQLIPNDGNTLDGKFTPNGKAFSRINADGTESFYLGGQFELAGKKIGGRLSCNGVYSISRGSLVEIENPADVQMQIGTLYGVYIEHRQFTGNDGKNVVYIPAYATTD